MDALLTALYVYLDDHVMPSRGRPRGRGRPPVLTSAEAVVVAVAQVLLRCDQERYWLRTAAARIGHLFLSSSWWSLMAGGASAGPGG
ncbi:hypothetical protein Misp01_07930 [Microtetraspora sp. NBRC 13810]|nr:hypothetical protein Misp01_07930 [Microtetraspora sp. NBRC 13810]